MRILRHLIVAASALALLGAASGCNEYLGNINEGVNVNNMAGKVVIPKAVLGSNALGVVYVGVFSGVDMSRGYLSPLTAPAQVGDGNTFPYGGTSVGDYYTRDARYVCQVITDRNVKDAGTNLEVDFQILQFPFYPGSAVWAFADNDNSTCDNNSGYYDATAIFVTPTDVQPNATGWTVTFDTTDLALFSGINGSGSKQFLDPAGRLYKVSTVNATALTANVTDVFNYGVAPSVTGPYPSQLIKPEANMYYGTQSQVVLNFPTSPSYGFVSTGDLVPTTPTIINDLSSVTLTLDSKVN